MSNEQSETLFDAAIDLHYEINKQIENNREFFQEFNEYLRMQNVPEDKKRQYYMDLPNTGTALTHTLGEVFQFFTKRGLAFEARLSNNGIEYDSFLEKIVLNELCSLSNTAVHNLDTINETLIKVATYDEGNNLLQRVGRLLSKQKKEEYEEQEQKFLDEQMGVFIDAYNNYTLINEIFLSYNLEETLANSIEIALGIELISEDDIPAIKEELKTLGLENIINDLGKILKR